MSKGGYVGYSFQKEVTELFLSKMDMERDIDSLEIEAKTDDKFDDLILERRGLFYQIQIKDIEGVSFKDITFSEGEISINNIPHKLSKNINIVLFRKIDITTNSEILGFESYLKSNIHFISLSRVQIDELRSSFYSLSPFRKSIIEKFLSECLDNRKWKIQKIDLPVISVFNTQLKDTINIKREIIEFDDILHINGKPGVGKSHLVEFLQEKFPNNILYRFWISEQDGNKESRLKYNNFLFDLSKKAFADSKQYRDEDEIIKKISASYDFVIIDGLDHVSNYNEPELSKFVNFINKIKNHCRVIILSRPIKKDLGWKKQTLPNWNKKQTELVLESLFHITDYKIKQQIFDATDGYPIIVKYVAEHYKKNKEIPILEKLSSLPEYYDRILSHTKMRIPLSIFLCTRSFWMRSEISDVFGNDVSEIVNEFVDVHPYLFDIKLNRIALFHDSLITYLKQKNINYSEKLNTVHEFVFKSIMSFEKRFLSRYSKFHLPEIMRDSILKKFISLEVYQKIMKGAVDYESIQEFYNQLREELSFFDTSEFQLIDYYDFSLIMNLLSRRHTSMHYSFQYTFLKGLLANGYDEDDITSSSSLFAMLYYIKKKDVTLLYNIASDNHYDIERVIDEIEHQTEDEIYYYADHEKPFSLNQLNKIFSQEHNLHLHLSDVMTNLYVHNISYPKYAKLLKAIKYEMDGFQDSLAMFKEFLSDNNLPEYNSYGPLSKAKEYILGLGKVPSQNDYLTLNLESIISKYKLSHHYELTQKVIGYIRLSTHQDRRINIASISRFWTKYHSRKDYSLLAIPNALSVFEKVKYLSTKDSCVLIHLVRELSEKGYRGIFNDYIEVAPVTIIEFLCKNFDINELNVIWFQLPVEYINVFPNSIFDSALHNEFRYNSTSKKINIEDIENVIRSNRFEDLAARLRVFNYSIEIPKDHELKTKLLQKNIIIEETDLKEEKSSKRSSCERYDDGILTLHDKEFILDNNLTCYDVAGFSNGWFMSMENPEIFKIFDPGQVKINLKKILLNAIIGKIQGRCFHFELSYLPGNIPKLIYDYDKNVSLEPFFQSFRKYIKLSLLELA